MVFNKSMVLAAFALIPASMMILLGMISISSPRRIAMLLGVCFLWIVAGSLIVIVGGWYDRLTAILCFAEAGAGVLGWAIAVLRRSGALSAGSTQ